MPDRVVTLVDQIMQWVQSAVWMFLAVAAFNVWRRHRDRSATWLAATFACLGIVIVAAFFLPSDPEDLGDAEIAFKVLIAILALFPYLLYRFVVTLVGKRRWAWITAHTLTGALIVSTMLLTDLEAISERPTGPARAYLFLFAAQWVFLLGLVSVRLWRAGRDQPAVARRRMQTMSLGSLTLAGTILLSIAFPQGEEVTTARIVTWAIGLLAGPLFLFGFAPPRLLRFVWRRREEAELRQVEITLMKALSQSEIADALLERTVGLLAGKSAALLDPDGLVLGRHLMPDEELERLSGQLPDLAQLYEPLPVEDARAIRMENGWLLVTVGPLTPFFGGEEIQMLSALAVLADLALGRAKLFELEAQSREAMRDFVAIASHDLRTPVTVIQGFSHLMVKHWDTLPDDQKLHFAEAIDRQIVHLDRLVRDILTVSKLDVEEEEVLPHAIDVSHSAEQVVAAIAADANVEIRLTGAVIAKADPEHIVRMLQNYLRNALVYGKSPYIVEIDGQGGWITVRVRDHGNGVPADFVPRLFEKFARVDKKKSKAVQGTGLGLSIVKGLARANGGDAWYEDNQPSGACFAFRLPEAAGGAHAEESYAHAN